MCVISNMSIHENPAPQCGVLPSERGSPASFPPSPPNKRRTNAEQKPQPHLAPWSRNPHPQNCYGGPGPPLQPFLRSLSPPRFPSTFLVLLPQLYIPRWDSDHPPNLRLAKEGQDRFRRCLVIEEQGDPGRSPVFPPATFAHVFPELLDLGLPGLAVHQEVMAGRITSPRLTAASVFYYIDSRPSLHALTGAGSCGP